MYGKLFLLAVVCVSFVQVRGDIELENAISDGIAGVKNSRKDLQKRVQNIRRGMQEIEGIVTENYKEFLNTMTLIEKFGYDKIQEVADSVKKHAKEDQKVLECADRESAAGNGKLQEIRRDYIVRGNEMTEAVRKAAPKADDRFKKLDEVMKQTAEEFIKKFESQKDIRNMKSLNAQYKAQFWVLETRISTIVSDLYKEVTTFEENMDASTIDAVTELRESFTEAASRINGCVGW